MTYALAVDDTSREIRAQFEDWLDDFGKPADETKEAIAGADAFAAVFGMG